jgi:hypothetical protein
MASSQSSSPSHSPQAVNGGAAPPCGNPARWVVPCRGGEPQSPILNAPVEKSTAGTQGPEIKPGPHYGPEFMRIVIPYEPAVEAEAERQDRYAALKAMEAREYQESLNVRRGIVNGMIICLVGWAIAIAWCLL